MASKVKQLLNIFKKQEQKTVKHSEHDLILVTFMKIDKLGQFTANFDF